MKTIRDSFENRVIGGVLYHMDMKNEFKKEKQRKLTPAEERRMERLDDISADLQGKGFRKVERTVGIVKANLIAGFIGVPAFILGYVLFSLVNPQNTIVSSMKSSTPLVHLLFWGIFVILIAVHEGIHGITWGLFAKGGIKDIEFGFMKEYMTPYCTCKTVLTKKAYIWGAMMPLIVLGIVPSVVGIMVGSRFLLNMGILMIISAGGDILLTYELVKYKSEAKEKYIYDHPTQAGCVVFEK
ncbi:DUF3267 domain-containing protein [Butyrivibrio sp. AE3004]|uniref:DUF3267 domain-containing protein n=1 Tax=Butyrivibrio sp. AE3004 TaxID=1506994 RepID=UPI0004948137|nr:DUF3267 domain-containing protein [Butyrivibrio sp. AE3004]